MLIKWAYRPKTYPETTNTSIVKYPWSSAHGTVPSDRVESRSIANNPVEVNSIVESLKRQYGNRLVYVKIELTLFSIIDP